MKNNLIINVLNKIQRSLTTNRNEPYIKRKSDRYGNLYWQIYDYQTNKSYTFGSELEVRAWLEQRYYRM